MIKADKNPVALRRAQPPPLSPPMFAPKALPEGSMVATTTTVAATTDERPQRPEAVDIERAHTIAALALEATIW